jgi:hypothetical protein
MRIRGKVRRDVGKEELEKENDVRRNRRSVRKRRRGGIGGG